MRESWPKSLLAANAQLRLRTATQVAFTARLAGRPFVQNDGTMIVRDRALLVSTVAALELVTRDGGTLDIGERSFVNYGTSLHASLLVKIGAHCHIGPHCILMDNDLHHLDPDRRLERPESAPIVLGDNVWLGARVIVMRGVTIGDGSVVGAGSIVTHDVPPRTLALGSPARVVRSL